jgi:hypothetical protein
LPPKTDKLCGSPHQFPRTANTHAEDVRVSQLRKRTQERKIGVRFFGDDPLESDGFPAKTVKFCGPPRRFPRTAKYSRRGSEGFPGDITVVSLQNWSPVLWGQPLESGSLPPKTDKLCGPPRHCPRAAKHSCRSREGFPAEKTGTGTQNWSPVFRGRPLGIRRFSSKNGQILRSPPPVSEGRKILTPRA